MYLQKVYITYFLSYNEILLINNSRSQSKLQRKHSSYSSIRNQNGLNPKLQESQTLEDQRNFRINPKQAAINYIPDDKISSKNLDDETSNIDNDRNTVNELEISQTEVEKLYHIQNSFKGQIYKDHENTFDVGKFFFVIMYSIEYKNTRFPN